MNESCCTDDTLCSVLIRTPFLQHCSLRSVCRRFLSIMSSPAFHANRITEGCAESFLIVAGGYDGSAHRAECWALLGSRWHPLAPLPAARSSCGVAAMNGELYLFGGHVSSSGDAAEHGSEDAQGGHVWESTSTSVIAYNFLRNEWRACAPMLERQGGAVVAALNNSTVIVAGGHDNVEGSTSAVHEYNAELDSWSRLSPMPLAVHGAAGGVIRNTGFDARSTLYIASGMSDAIGNGYCEKVQEYDSIRRAWKFRADIPSPRYASTAGRGLSLNGELLIVGGFDSRGNTSELVYRYDPKSDSWSDSSFPRLPGRRARFRVAAHEGNVYLVGGGAPLVLAPTARTADDAPQTPARTWQELPRLPIDVDFAAVASVRLG